MAEENLALIRLEAEAFRLMNNRNLVNEQTDKRLREIEQEMLPLMAKPSKLDEVPE